MIARRFNHSNFPKNKMTGMNPRGLIKDLSLNERYRDRETTLLNSSGSPHLWFKRIHEIPCYCREERNESGHVNCPTCYGSGWLQSWEKTGYRDFTFAKTSPDVDLSGVKFSEGWGYREVMRGTLLSPILDLAEFQELSILTADQFTDGVTFSIEHSYDDQTWLQTQVPGTEAGEPIDPEIGDQIRFRLTTDGSRFLRIRWRVEDFTEELPARIPDDIYIQVSAADKRVVDKVREREYVAAANEPQAWTLSEVESGDFIADYDNPNDPSEGYTVSLINAVDVGQHQQDKSEYRRDMVIRPLVKDGFLRNLYRIPL